MDVRLLIAEAFVVESHWLDHFDKGPSDCQNLVERLVFTAPPGPIGIGPVREALPTHGRPRARTGRLSEAVQEFERKEIETALQEARGSMTQAAARLGLERSHLYKKMKKLGMRPESWSG